MTMKGHDTGMFGYQYNPYNYFDVRVVNSYVRILHASPDAPPVDVYADGNLIARNLSYRGFTEYMPLPPGTYNIKIYSAGQTTNPVLDTTADIPLQSIFTIAAIGMLADLSLLGVPDTRIPTRPGMTYMRFVHLSPNAPNVDVALSDGNVPFSNVAYKGITNYIPAVPGTYTFNIRLTGTNTVVLYVPNIRLLPDKIYTIYAVGLMGGTPGLQVLIPLDGSTYIKF